MLCSITNKFLLTSIDDKQLFQDVIGSMRPPVDAWRYFHWARSRSRDIV